MFNIFLHQAVPSAQYLQPSVRKESEQRDQRDVTINSCAWDWEARVEKRSPLITKLFQGLWKDQKRPKRVSKWAIFIIEFPYKRKDYEKGLLYNTPDNLNLCSKWSLLATHISLHPAWVDCQCPNLDKLHQHVLASYTRIRVDAFTRPARGRGQDSGILLQRWGRL